MIQGVKYCSTCWGYSTEQSMLWCCCFQITNFLFYFPLHPQVLSGCAIIVRGQPRGGPPPERQINLSNIRAGNLARRAAAAQLDAKDTPDEVGSS